jgi:hypothetical protein
MNFSADINQWDYSTITRLVTQRDAEPGIYDFKEVLIGTGNDENKKKLNESIRKAVCSMANADGGYIIFGVKDPKKHPNLTAEQRIVGIPKSSEYLKEFGDKISSIERNVPCVYPDRLIGLPYNNTHGIFVVHVPLSPLRPHMIEGTFYTRVSTGSAEPMDWHEVRDQMLYTEGRLQKVKLLRLKIAQFKNQIGTPLGHQWEQELALNSRYDVNSFEIVFADVCDLIPFQTGLLEKLVKLSRTAADLNIILDPNTSFANYFNRTSAQGERSNLLGRLCAECEEQLTQIFGPLTSDKT